MQFVKKTLLSRGSIFSPRKRITKSQEISEPPLLKEREREKGSVNVRDAAPYGVPGGKFRACFGPRQSRSTRPRAVNERKLSNYRVHIARTCTSVSSEAPASRKRAGAEDEAEGSSGYRRALSSTIVKPPLSGHINMSTLVPPSSRGSTAT